MAEEPIIQPVPDKPKLTPRQKKQEALFADTLDSLAKKYRSQRFQDQKVNNTCTHITDFKESSGKFPWQWTREDFEEHSAYLFKVRGNSSSTQRGKQLDIKQYMDYLISSKYKQVIYRELGITLEQICFPGENMIAHKSEYDNQKKRRDLSADELNKFFSEMDDEIMRCYNSGHKGMWVAMRDKAVFDVLADFGLRVDELVHLNIKDIGANPDCPEFGNYGYVDVWFGKGTKGSGKKHRRVWTLDLRAAQLLKWYVEEVRPTFIGRNTEDIDALFYSERGTRLSVRSIQIACKRYLNLFNMYEDGLVPHSFRHSYTTFNQEIDGVSANLMQRQTGHEELSTTQRYTHYKEPAIKKMRDHAIDVKLLKNKRRRQLDEDQPD